MIIEKTENGIYKMLDLSNLPRKMYQGQECTDWLGSTGCKIPFHFDGYISGEIVIKDVFRECGRTWVIITANNKIKKVSQTQLMRLQFTSVLKKYREPLPSKKREPLITLPFYKNGEIVNKNLKILKTISKKKGSYSYEVRCEVYSTAPSYVVQEHRLKSGRASRYASGQVTCLENSVWSTVGLREIIVNPLEAKRTFKTSPKKVECVCLSCSLTKKVEARVLHERGFFCQKCDISSFPEKFIEVYLELEGIKYVREYSFPNSKKRFDFFLPKSNRIIEVHGRQHYEDTTGSWGISSLSVIENDKYKKLLAQEHGVSVVEVDARKSTLDFLTRSVNQEKSLPKITESRKSKIKRHLLRKNKEINTIKKQYEAGVEVNAIAKEFNCSIGTVYEKMKNLGVSNQKRKVTNSKKIVRLHDKKLFPSMRVASIATHKAYGQINYRRSTGRDWMYYEDYIGKYGTEDLTEYVEEDMHNDTGDLKVKS